MDCNLWGRSGNAGASGEIIYRRGEGESGGERDRRRRGTIRIRNMTRRRSVLIESVGRGCS